jgi:hypothetical protein
MYPPRPREARHLRRTISPAAITPACTHHLCGAPGAAHVPHPQRAVVVPAREHVLAQRACMYVSQRTPPAQRTAHPSRNVRARATRRTQSVAQAAYPPRACRGARTATRGARPALRRQPLSPTVDGGPTSSSRHAGGASCTLYTAFDVLSVRTTCPPSAPACSLRAAHARAPRRGRTRAPRGPRRPRRACRGPRARGARARPTRAAPRAARGPASAAPRGRARRSRTRRRGARTPRSRARSAPAPSYPAGRCQ